MAYAKRRTAVSIIAALTLFAVIAGCGNAGQESASPPPENTELFANGNYAFIRSYESSPDACKTNLSIVERNGKNALFVDVSAGGTPYLAIDVSSLLGGAVSSMRTMEVDVETESIGEFYAVSGTISALSGADRLQSAPDPWSVYLASKNPNIARIALAHDVEYMIPDAYNMFIFTKEVDNAITAGLAPTNLYILGLRFYDVNGTELYADPDAGFAAPEGFGKPDRSNLLGVDGEAVIGGATGSSIGGWGQAVAVTTTHGGGAFDAAVIAQNTVVTVYYASETAPELILQSWSGGEGWAKVAPSHVNDSGTIAQYTYDDIITAFNSDDITGLLDQLYVGDTGAKLDVFSVTVGNLTGGDAQ
ncbi:MAG: hypothetical protein LBN00_09650 [Oscillospiraceae bacterium]|nr:hypothetical protein [Oscillospiraceae bacterium]